MFSLDICQVGSQTCPAFPTLCRATSDVCSVFGGMKEPWLSRCSMYVLHFFSGPGQPGHVHQQNLLWKHDSNVTLERSAELKVTSLPVDDMAGLYILIVLHSDE